MKKEKDKAGKDIINRSRHKLCDETNDKRPSFKRERKTQRMAKVALAQNARQNHGMTLIWDKLCAMAQAEVERTLESLPEPLQASAVRLPVIFERRPNAELQADGIEPDTLGLFTGAKFVEENDVPLPPQIILFLENLWVFAETNEQCFREEVRTTFLHELGHYLGLDEDELTERGLE